MIFSVPGKHFILGEYAVLEQGTALLFAQGPRFTLTVIPGTPELIGIPSNSPAHRYYQQCATQFGDHRLIFNDPYQGVGGLGASSAQFILLYAFCQYQQHMPATLAPLLQRYQTFAGVGQGYPPSGADVVAQFTGHLLSWAPTTQTATPLPWPFAELDFHFLHTGHKIPTHEHLRTLQTLSVTELSQTVESALIALQQQDSVSFCNAVNLYANLLDKRQLTTGNTQALLASINTLPGVKAAKGCGALGSDVVFIITEKNYTRVLQDWSQQHHLRYLGCLQDSAPGLSMNLNPTTE